MSVKMKPTSTIKARLGIEKNGKVQRFFTNTCYKRMDKYVPMRDGNLRTIVDIQPDSITYESEYAHAQYVGHTKGPVQNYTTPGTGPYWAERMKSAEMGEIIDEVQNFINKGGK